MFHTSSVSVECFAVECDAIVALHILVIQSCRLIVELKAMNGEHRPLVKKMTRLSLRNNRLEFKASAKLPIIFEESMEYTSDA